ASGLCGEWYHPLPGALLGERYVAPARRSPRRSAGLAVEHESQQPANLGLTRHQLQKDACQPDRLFGQSPAALIDACHVVPADPKSGVDGLQDSVEALRQLALLGNLELDAAIANLCLGTNQALP